MRYRVSTIAPILVLLTLAAGVRLRAQMPEIPHPEPRPEQAERPSADERNRPNEDESGRVSEQGGVFPAPHLPADDLPMLREMTTAHSSEYRYVEPNDVRFERNPAWDPRYPGKSPKYIAYRYNHRDGSHSAPLSQGEVQKLYASGRPIVQAGAATQDRAWNEFTRPYADRTVIHEEHSANRNWTEISDAVNLGNRRLDPKSTVIFNALPQQRGAAFAREQARMRIGGNAKAWEELNENIRSSSGEFASRVATRQDLLRELGSGTASVVILYAHFDGQHLYLPDPQGGKGEQISIEEFANLKDRSNDATVKDRIIVLAVCSTAATPAAGAVPDSLVSLLLQKGIGRAVFATQYPYDARQIPDLMKRLSSGTGPRSGGGQLRQYVELFPVIPNGLSPEMETESGE